MKTIKTLLVIALLLPFAIFGEEMDDSLSDTKLSAKRKLGKANAKNIDYTLKASVYGGAMFGNQSYDVSSPVTGGSLYGDVEFNFTPTWFLKITDKFEGEKGFEGAQNTNLTLDYLKNNSKVKFGFDNDVTAVTANMNWIWMYKPQWPDLYQPNPLSFADAQAGLVDDPAYGDYFPTDRNSYNKFEPELSLGYNGVKNLEIEANISYDRYLKEVDPNYNETLAPNHLTPSSYNGFNAELNATYKFSNLFSLGLDNKIYSRDFDNKLARDALTGSTNGGTNPLYSEFNYKVTLIPEFNIKAIKMKIKPFFALDINEDQYQGYYSYTGYEPGIEIEQKIGKFKYTIGFSYDMLEYGPDSFDPTTTYDTTVTPAVVTDQGTTDGQRLYKHYTKASIDLEYKFNNHFEIFIEGRMLLKDTNYPSYVPGEKPASSKNYNIDFNYDNYYIRSGVTYRL